MPTQPTLGYGKPTETTIDQANQAMRAMPWYQQMMRSFGQDPGHPTLTDAQRQQVLRGAQAAGFVVDEGNMELDPHGNFNPKGHALRNTLIVGGIAAATIATMGAAGAFAGAAGGAMGAGAGAGLSAVEGGAYGLGSGALAGLGTGAMAAVPVAAGASGVGLSGILGTAGKLASAFSGASSGRAAGRIQENAANNAYTDALQNQYRTQVSANANENDFGLNRSTQDFNRATAVNTFGLNRANAGVNIGNLDLDQKKFAIAAPGQRAGNAVRGDILSTAKDVALAGTMGQVPTISGGLRPSMFSDNTRQLGGLMSSQALSDQKKGDTFAPLPDLPNYQAPSEGLPSYVKPPPAPGVIPPDQATGLDSILNTASSLAPFASILANYKKWGVQS